MFRTYNLLKGQTKQLYIRVTKWSVHTWRVPALNSWTEVSATEQKQWYTNINASVRCERPTCDWTCCAFSYKPLRWFNSVKSWHLITVPWFHKCTILKLRLNNSVFVDLMLWNISLPVKSFWTVCFKSLLLTKPGFIQSIFTIFYSNTFII